ncbi:hypothetical protein ACH5RR_015330 [Cinchona calisaya]|uniref:Protein kinase domain-containing protein n=1 Tax=Cinchona calisaya TaxID=153742 RepID=A0ABD2ZSU1_9GENT
MVRGAMGGRWTTYKIKLSYIMLFILVPERCFSLNSEGLALLEFRSRVTSDSFGTFANWNPDDNDPCMWSGVHCADGEVQMLDLKGCSLEGVLATELGKLTRLKSLILSENQFSGVIPKQFGWLAALEVLDLRNNNLSGSIPAEIGSMHSLKQLMLSNNKFEGSIPLEIVKLDQLIEMQFDVNLTPSVAEVGCINRKLGHCEWSSSLTPLRKADSFLTPIKETINLYFDLFPILGKDSLRTDASDSYGNLPSPSELHVIQNFPEIPRRKLAEQSTNVAAYLFNNGPLLADFVSSPGSTSSGSFPAVPSQKNISSPSAASTFSTLQPSSDNTSNQGFPSSLANQPTDKHPPASGNSEHTWKYIVGISVGGFLIFVAAAMFVVIRGRTARNIGPWKTGLSGQLQKAFVTGVPKLNSAELETACEDFSNIVQTHDVVTVYKGTLSSGVEIAVTSTTVASLKDWSNRAEIAFRKKIESLSRVNHKNFVNLIGYCEEDEPFFRMMVFEYAPNGNLFEHLHVKELEHLDWSARMRIIMGTAYCLQHMHGLNPPVTQFNLNSKTIFLTDDYAAKIADCGFWAEFVPKSGENEADNSELPPLQDDETDVYNFGVLLLEVISGKLPYSEEHVPLLNWAAEYLNDKRCLSYLIDPTLKSFKDMELDIICEVILECVQQDARKRPTMKEVATKLRDVIDISPDSATPRLSPLWWAELEILSSEAA